MDWLRTIRERVLALFGRTNMDAEMDEELSFHIEKETEKYVRQGMDPAGARRRALIAFGGVERFREKTREERGVRLLEDLGQDSSRLSEAGTSESGSERPRGHGR